MELDTKEQALSLFIERKKKVFALLVWQTVYQW